jgi:alkylation response protein AidB-like acyl-CoA dehydrogenase
MDFALTEEQEMLKKSAREFLTAECPKSVVRQLEDSDSGHSPQLWKKMAQLGWMGILIPEQYGGVGWTMIEQAVLFEEYGRAAIPGPMFATLMGTLAILESGTEGQKKAFLLRVASGDLILTVALDEPEAVYAPALSATRALPKANGYSISGTKLFVPYANVADCMIAAARTAGRPGDEKGITLFAVKREDSGIRLTPIKTIAVDRQFQVDLDAVSVTSDDIMGRSDLGATVIRAVLDKATAVQCAEMLGGAQQELEMTAEYTKRRVQFSRPIGTFQAVQHRLADMFIDVQGARWTTYQAVWRLSQGMQVARELAIAKFIAGKACQRVAFSAQQLHGGIGVHLDADLHFYYRRAKAFELTLGTPSVHLKALEAHIGA